MMAWSVVYLKNTLGKYKSDWDRLNNELYDAHPFFDSRFVESLLEFFGDGKELLCVHCDKRGNVDGLLIVVHRRAGFWSLFLPSQAQIAPVLIKNPKDLMSLFNCLPGAALVLELVNQDPNYSIVCDRSILQPLWRQYQATTINIDLKDSFSAFWKSRSKILQKNIRRYCNRISREAGTFNLKIVSAKDELEEAIARYGDLETCGWKGKEGTAVSITNLQGKFYLSLLEKFSRENNASVYELFIADELAASRLCISNESQLIILKTSYKETMSRFAPGRVLLFLILEREFEKKRVSSVEFYTNANKDQISWSTGKRDIEHVTLFKNKLLLKVFKVLHRIKGGKGGGGKESSELITKQYCNFEELPESYRSLMKQANNKSFDLEYDWFFHLSKTALTENQKEVLVAAERRQDGKAICLLPLIFDSKKGILQSLSTFYTSLYLPCFDSCEPEKILKAVFDYIKNNRQRYPVLRLFPIPVEDPLFSAMETALTCSGWKTFRYFCFGNWYLPVEGRSYDEYFGILPTVLRNTLIRKEKKFVKVNGRYEVIFGGDQLEDAIIAYEEIYHSSWKASEPFPEFMPGLMRYLAEKGQLRLGIAYVENEPVAAQVWVVSQGKAAIYKLSYKRAYSKLSVGTLLTQYLMRYVLDVDKVKEVDFLIGDDSYKKNWMTHRRERWGILAFNVSTFRGFVGWKIEYLRRLLKFLLQSIKVRARVG